jgi:pyruvate ferredoxin oxidoreductase gamma subunit
MMFQVRIHGRGGQGVVTAAELLAVAAFEDGLYAQAFPAFGSERMGAPILAFCRTDDRAIRLREPIVAPDALIIQDPTLLHHVDTFSGLGPDGYLIVNTTRTADDLGLGDVVRRLRRGRVALIPASDLARRSLGRPLPNAALLGGFAALTAQISLGSLSKSVRERFQGATGDGNVMAAEMAYQFVQDAVRVRGD